MSNMSHSLIQVPLVKVLTPHINLYKDKKYVIAKGAKENTFQQFPATSLSNTQININIQPPNRRTIVSREIFAKATMQLTMTGTAGAGTKLIQPGLDAPRAFPLNNSINILSAQIENDTVSVNSNQIQPILQRYHYSKAMSGKYLSTTPSFLDAYQEYNDYANAYSGGSAKNSLAGYGESDSIEGNRGGFSGYTIVSDDGTTAVVNITVTEPLFLPPFNFSGDEEAGFVGIQNIQLSFAFLNELGAKWWSHNNVAAGHSTLSNITANFTDFAVLVNFNTLPDDLPVPQEMPYDYASLTPYPSTVQAIASGASTTISMGSLNLTSMPRRLYIFAMEDIAQKSFANGGANKTDTYGFISALNLTLNNKVGLLSTATAQDLYQMSVNNGLNMSWSQFNNYVGSVICVDLSKDLSLDTAEASGLLAQTQLNVTATVKNPNTTRSINYILWVIPVYEGVFNIVNGACSHQIGVFNREQILTAPIDHTISWKRTETVYGGDFVSAIKTFFTKGLPYIKGFFEKAPLVGKIVGDVGDLFGQKKQASGFVPIGGKAKPKASKKKAGVLVGGELLSRNQMRNNMQQY